jgi:hypothetical protein
MASAMSIPVVTPADVHSAPSRTNTALRSTVTWGRKRASRSHADQCVVARSPSSRPAAASTNAPVHTEARRCTRPCARRNQRTQAPSRTTAVTGASSPPATITVSWRRGRRRRRSRACAAIPEVKRIGPPPGAASVIS